MHNQSTPYVEDIPVCPNCGSEFDETGHLPPDTYAMWKCGRRMGQRHSNEPGPIPFACEIIADLKEKLHLSIFQEQ